MIDIKKKVQAAKDYASKSYRVIRKVSKNGFMVQRDKNADKHFLDGIDWAEKEIFKDLLHPASEVPRNDNGKVLAFSRVFCNRKLLRTLCSIRLLAIHIKKCGKSKSICSICLIGYS